MQGINEEEKASFKWRKNTDDERRRMRSNRKKRKRNQRRKQKEATLKGLNELLEREARQNQRNLHLARKYYSKWKQNKELLSQATGQEKKTKHPQQSNAYLSEARLKVSRNNNQHVHASITIM